MKHKIICKTLAVAVIILFLGLAIQPSVAITEERINNPPDAPEILRSHPRNHQSPIGFPPTIYWNITTTDPDGDDIYLFIDWEDGTTSGWFGLYHSDERVPVNHTYSEMGTYCIRARAKDIYGAIGDWGEENIPIGDNSPPDVTPKDYLFQTIIEIANNPYVKDLFEQYDNDLFKVDIDRGVYRKLLLRNPSLMFNTLFTKPTMSVEYLDKCYNKGIEVTDIIGEDKVLEIIENVEVRDTRFFDTLNNILSKDEELSYRFETLKEINKKQNPDWEYPVICSILTLIATPSALFTLICLYIFNNCKEDSIIRIILKPFYTISLLVTVPILFYLMPALGCIYFPWWYL